MPAASARFRRYAQWAALAMVLWICTPARQAVAQNIPIPTVPGVERAESPDDVVLTLEIMFMLTVLTLAPSILMMMTSFTRIVIVLSFLRRALATQELPPNQIVIGLSLILTFMIMRPTFLSIKDDALVPYIDAEISQKTAFDRSLTHMRDFMFTHVLASDLSFFLAISRTEVPDRVTRKDVPTLVLVPAFVISELKRAFEMGFLLYLPFVIIDLVVSSALISMGMLVLPPVLISLPFKILLFVLVDGWQLIIGSIVASFAPG